MQSKYKQLHNLSFKNKKLFKKYNEVSCFFCLKDSLVISIKEWTDKGQTALCPKCNIDSLIPKGIATNEELNELGNLAFSQVID